MFKSSLYYQYFRSIGLGLLSAGVTIALSFLPYADWLQALWVIVSTAYLATRSFNRRVNEDDTQRFKRLNEERIRFWSRRDPDVLNALFSQNVGSKQLDWLSEELDVDLSSLDEIHALDSLSQAGDQPGQLSLRAGLLLGRWQAEVEMDQSDESSEKERDLLSGLQSQLHEWITEHETLLGKEIAPNIYLRHIKQGERRPVGIHLFSEKSKLLFTYEELTSPRHEDKERPATYSVALSLDAQLTRSLSDEEWDAWLASLFEAFPYFRRVQQGSGPQRRDIPYFIQPRLPVDTLNTEDLVVQLSKLYEQLSDATAEQK